MRFPAVRLRLLVVCRHVRRDGPRQLRYAVETPGPDAHLREVGEELLHIPIHREHPLGLHQQGRERCGSETTERLLPGKEFAMPTGSIAMEVIEEVL